MFVRQNQQQFRNSNADVQIFYAPAPAYSASTTQRITSTWNKPPGVSHVYILCIGAGANGDGAANGGGSGGTTVWYGAAQNVPDVLGLQVGFPVDGAGNGFPDSVIYFGTGTTVLMSGRGASIAPTSGSVETNRPFASSGFFQTVAGQNGSATNITTPSSTTFLSGGSNTASVTGNYGYTNAGPGAQQNGFSLLQPIIVGVGGSNNGKAGFGCGGGVGGAGGNGLILIASW